MAGVGRATATVTLLQFMKYHKALRARGGRGGLVPQAVAVPPGAEQKLKSLRRRYSQYAQPSAKDGWAERMRAPGFESFLYESGMLTGDLAAGAAVSAEAAAAAASRAVPVLKDEGGSGR